MDFNPGSKYKETKARLKESIRDGTISALEVEAENHSCFFTGKPIMGRAIALTEREIGKGIEVETRYFLAYDSYISCSPNIERALHLQEGNFSVN